MDIATQVPTANFDGRFVTVSVQSGSKLIELALDANQSMFIARAIQREARKAFEQQAVNNVIAFRAQQNAD
ncbi:hypothetical protein [Aurantiacibacter sp. MUD61]|uniref:hypothetical protein n=1 Tax=Aurantiacibacter sp. MUD61 TaxID=3009083 RepID=UPI0022EFD8F6|nr:hypothetical protein [Aurantiacibacter sp. MUD61]